MKWIALLTVLLMFGCKYEYSSRKYRVVSATEESTYENYIYADKVIARSLNVVDVVIDGDTVTVYASKWVKIQLNNNYKGE